MFHSTNLVLLAILVLLPLQACNRTPLERALEFAGENRSELEAVMEHYSENERDSLKLKSAIFLIENMPFHFTYEGSSIDYYYDQVALIYDLNLKPEETRERIDSLLASIGDPLSNGVLKRDIHHITADYLISNIDHAYNSWQNGLWAKHLTFEDFCEYILPYRYGTENIEYWREELEDKFKKEIKWLETYGQKRNSAYWAALHLNKIVKPNTEYMPPFPLDHPVSYYDKMTIGDCRDYCIYAMLYMRACGIPVNVDYTPQWAHRSLKHFWNVVLDNTGKDVVFLAAIIDPGYPHYPSINFGKVFRQTYAFQKNSLFAIKGKEDVPQILNSPFIKDVSQSYFEGMDINIKLPGNLKTSNKFAYLAVFDNQQWIPIQWGKIGRGKKVGFSQMGKNIVYLPVLYENNSVQGVRKNVSSPIKTGYSHGGKYNIFHD